MNRDSLDGVVRYVRTNLDELGLVTALGHVAAAKATLQLSEEELAVLDALVRADPALAHASLDDVRDYLSGLDDDQLQGLVSNVKGVLHEMEFVALENSDRDSVYASYFPETNHPDTDVHLIDTASGETWDVQLKATDDPAYVQEWIDAHPGGEIEVTEELAARMHLESSGFSNGQLTAQVEEFVDKLVESDSSPDLFDHFPVLSVASATVVVWALWKRYRDGDITRQRFVRLAVLATGMKAAKIGVLMVLLSVPIVSQVTAVVLVGRLILSARGMIALGRSSVARSSALLAFEGPAPS